MPEQLLDDPQVSPGLEQMRGKAVPKPVRSDGLAHPALLQILLEKPLDTPGGQPAPSAIEEEHGPVATEAGGARHPLDLPAAQRTSRRQVRLQGLSGGPPDGDDPLSSPLPSDLHQALLEVQVFDGEIHELPHADPRGVKELQDRPIPESDRRCTLGRGEELKGLIHREMRRKQPGKFGRRYQPGGIPAEKPATAAELKERA